MPNRGSWVLPGAALDQPPGTVHGYDVHYTSAPETGTGAVVNDAAASGGDPAAAWVAVPRNGPAAMQTIGRLAQATVYRLRVRAKNSGVPGAWLFGAMTTATLHQAPAPQVAAHTPAQGNAIIWSAILTPASIVAGTAVGCDNSDVSSKRCSNPSVLSNDRITTGGGAELAVPRLTYSQISTSSTLNISFSESIPQYLRAGMLRIGSNAIPMSSMDEGSSDAAVGVYAPNVPGLLTAGTRVRLSIEIPAPTVTLSVSPREIWEGGSARVTAALSHPMPHDVRVPVTVTPCETGSWCAYMKNSTIRIPAGSTTGRLRILDPVRGSTRAVYETKTITERVWDPVQLRHVDRTRQVTVKTATATGPFIGFKAFRDADADNEEVTVALGSNLPSGLTAGGVTSAKVTVLDIDGYAPTLSADRQPAEGEVVTVTLDLGGPAPAGFFATLESLGTGTARAFTASRKGDGTGSSSRDAIPPSSATRPGTGR